MTRRDQLVDAGVTVSVLAASLLVLVLDGIGTPSPDATALDATGVALVAAACLPLLVRRRAPLAAYLGTAAGTAALLVLRYPLDFPFSCAVAIYTLAAVHGGDPRRGRRWAARLAVGAFVPVAAGAYAAAGFRGHGVVSGIGAWALTFAGAWLAGELSRVRRERIDELEERATRAAREIERERRLAVAEERTRIARELHDSAGHAVNVILVQAGAARLTHDRDPQRSLRAIATVEEVARSTIVEMERLVRALRDDDAEPVPADPGALEELLDRHRVDGLRIDAELNGPDRALPRSVSWAAYRILQESLTNAARHGCGTARVAVDFRADAVEIAVSNPAPATPAGLRGRRHGIVGMRERATLLGGTLETAAEQGEFRLRARLPYDGVGR
ncbi:sensor histidine kinase [Micromonospora echinaurantiaca]|uniref:sensor histidine kinase n=1 Tax=Micromonospora echinaurantiaca TaxID=47857 RepID=UPI003415E0E9